MACQIDKFMAVTVRFRYDRDGGDALKLPGAELYNLGKARFVTAAASSPPGGVRDLSWGQGPTPDLKRVPGSDTVWVGPRKPPAPFLGVAASDEDYIFEHGRLVAGDIYYAGPAAYAAIKRAAVKACGPPSTADLSDAAQIYAWVWPKAKVRLQLSYNSLKASTTLHVEKME